MNKERNREKWVDYLPISFVLGNHLFKVIQYDELYDEDGYGNYGQFDYSDLTIRIKISKDGNEDNLLHKEIILNTYWHEVFHTFNYLWNTEVDESLAQSFANFMRELESTSNYAQKK
jgi:hypothetical protein